MFRRKFCDLRNRALVLVIADECQADRRRSPSASGRGLRTSVQNIIRL